MCMFLCMCTFYVYMYPCTCMSMRDCMYVCMYIKCIYIYMNYLSVCLLSVRLSVCPGSLSRHVQWTCKSCVRLWHASGLRKAVSSGRRCPSDRVTFLRSAPRVRLWGSLCRGDKLAVGRLWSLSSAERSALTRQASQVERQTPSQDPARTTLLAKAAG